MDILAGHVCPAHSRYLDFLEADKAWKHSVGAAVQLKIEGFEHRGKDLLALVEKLHLRQLEKHDCTRRTITYSENSWSSTYLKVTISPKAWWDKPIHFTSEWIGIEVRADLETGALCAHNPKIARDLRRY